MVDCQCLQCHKKFKVYPSEIKKGSGKFCSRSCKTLHQMVNNPKFGFSKGHKLNKGNQYATGNKHTDEWRQEASERMVGNTNGFKTGQVSPRKGKQSSKPAWNKGKKLPEFSGPNHPNWIADRSDLKKSEKKHLDGRYRDWVKSVKERDAWKCQIDNKDCCGRLEAHHILPWRKFPELRYNVNNGITLCKYHHPLKEKDEERLVTFYQSIIGNDIPHLS